MLIRQNSRQRQRRVSPPAKRHWPKLAVLLGAMLLSTVLAAAAGAQSYRFGVPKLQMLVTVKDDASVHIVYDITFANQPGAHAIDIVDIGTPHKGYNLGKITASIDGHKLRRIRHSTEIGTGFEVHLGAHAIPAGGQGALHVEFDMPEMVYQDTTDQKLASLRITPTWFGGQYIKGNTHIQVAVQLPRSVHPDEALHQGPKAGPNFASKAVTDNGALVGWDWPADRLAGPHQVAVSFPKRDMQRVVKITKLGMLLKWFSNSAQARVITGMVFLALFGVLFFRFSGGTGFSVFFIFSAFLVLFFFLSPVVHLLAMPAVVVLIGINEWYLAHRKESYMPPIAQIEGGGIKRGLTAPEAAVLLELPVGKVLSLVIFGMLKKGILRQTQAEPLAVEIDPAFDTPEGQLLASAKDRAKFYRQVGQKKGVVVHQYEHPFIYLLRNNPGKPVKELNFGMPMKTLIARVAARMKGFDLSDTKDYYRSIIDRACRQAGAIGDIPQREKTIDRDFEWILMDEHYPTVFTYGRPYRPVWTRGTTLPGSGAPSAGPGPAGSPSFGDVAASFTGWTENTMGSMASAIMPGSLAAGKPGGGFLNLSGADKVTGEFFQAMAEAAASGSSGGGGGCACACAGCACACACAGGGR